MKFIYKDTKKQKWNLGLKTFVPEVVFEIEAQNIYDADKSFKDKFGKDPTEMKNIEMEMKGINVEYKN